MLCLCGGYTGIHSSRWSFSACRKPGILCEADGEGKLPISPLQAHGILGWLRRKTDSWKKIMLLMKKNMLNMQCLLIWEAVNGISADLIEECTDCKSDGAICRFTSSQRSTMLLKGGLSHALKLLEPIKEKYPEPSYAHLFQLIFVVAI